MIKSTYFLLVIPCYNEALAIPEFLKELVDFKNDYRQKIQKLELNIIAPKDLHVIFVNNNSTDDSGQHLRLFCNEHNFCSLIDCKTQGYGAALKAGFSSQPSNYYAFTDLDGTYPLRYFIPMLQDIAKNESLGEGFDMYMTNRFSPHSQMPFLRKIGNYFYAFLCRGLFKSSLQDVCSGMRIWSKNKKTEILSRPENGLDFSIALTAMALKKKWKIESFDIEYKERSGPSKLSVMKDGWLFLKTLVKVKFFEK